MLAAAQGGRCDEMFLGTDIGWVDVMEYHDADGSCAISMQELGNVCKTHYQACLSFLQNSHTTKDGSVQCGDQEMMNRMMKGGDVCCDYTDGRNCGTFPVSGPQDTAEECADTGAVDTTSLSLRMPLNRNCRYWVTALRFPNVVLPKAAVIDEAYVLFPVRTAGTQSGPVSLRIFVEASDNAAPLSAMVSGITSRVNSNHGVQWSPDSWPTSQNVQMSADIGGLLAQLTSRPGWEPGNAIVVKIEPATQDQHSNRIALSYDDGKMLPAVRIVYHTDETIARSIQAYHVDMTQVAAAEAESWSTTEAVGLVVVAVALVVGYNRRYGRARGAKYDRVQTEEEGRSLVDDDLGDFDVEGDVAPVQRDRRGNPVAKAIVSEGATADSTKFVYRDSSGNVR